MIHVGEGNLDQLCTGAVLVNLLDIKEEKRGGRKWKRGIYRVGLIGNPAGGLLSLCNRL